MSKLLLMGSAGAGKTSMQRVLFANMLPKETSNIGYTVAREEHKIYLLGGLTFSLWDCGFQDQFVQEYFDSQKGIASPIKKPFFPKSTSFSMFLT